MCGASLPAHGLRRLWAQHPHPHNCLCRWRFWLSCLERRGRSAIPKHTHGHTHTHPKMHLPVKPQLHNLQPQAPTRSGGGVGGRGAGRRWQGQEEGAAQRLRAQNKHRAKQTFLSLLISYSSVFHPQKEAGFCQSTLPLTALYSW